MPWSRADAPCAPRSRLSQHPEQLSTTFGGRVHTSQRSMTNLTSSDNSDSAAVEDSGGQAAADDETGGDGAADAPVPPAEPP